MATRKTAEQVRDTAKAKWETLVYNKRSKDIKNQYDVVNTDNTDKRRSPKIEMGAEETILKSRDRLKMINLCRDLERNSSSAKGILKQLKLNVVGTEGKMQLNTSDADINKTVNDWFNKSWAVNSDSKSNLHFGDQLKLILASVIREGDCLVVFDDIDLDNGKLICYESDQLVQINEVDWKKQTDWVENGEPMQQSSGVVYNSRGEVQAYIATQKHGLTYAEMKDVTIFPVNTALLVKNVLRMNQLRGTGDFFSAVQDIEDIYEMRAKELQSAKLAGTFAGQVTKKDGGIDEAIFRGGIAPDGLLDSPSDTAESTTVQSNYDNLEMLTGGAMEYIMEGEEFKAIDFDRPNLNVQHFYDFVLQTAGAGMGLAKAYTKLETMSSYTAFRGEIMLTWVTFYEWQKFLERYCCDWIAVKAIQWGLDNNKLSVNLEVGWEKMISWTFPVQPQVDPTKDNTARRESMKDGFVDFSSILGPDWKQKLESVAEGLKFAKELGLPLTAFETVSGAEKEDTTINKDDE